MLPPAHEIAWMQDRAIGCCCGWAHYLPARATRAMTGQQATDRLMDLYLEHGSKTAASGRSSMIRKGRVRNG